MPTRELIYLSFGSLPAFFTTHHLNTQTGYFDYSTTAPVPLIDHDISWQEGLDGRGAQRYTPRWLVYDVRGGFEGLRREEIYDDQDEDVDDADGNAVDGGNIVESASSSSSNWVSSPQIMRTGTQGKVHRTPFRRIAQRERKGEYVDWDEEMEKEMASDDDDDDEALNEEEESSPATSTQSQETDVTVKKGDSTTSRQVQRRRRPWSSKLLFEHHPRSLVPVTAAGGLPLENMSAENSSEGVEIFESFEQGWKRAKDWDRENDTLDTSFRPLMEASDHAQGFNITLQSSDAWGGFSAWHVEELADEYPKLERLAWSMRWGQGLGDIKEAEDGTLNQRQLRLARIRAMNETLSLLLLTETASLLTPLAAPEWPKEGSAPNWTQHLRQDKRTRLQADEDYNSAILASHFETATLGMRLRDSPTSASTLVSHLRWRGDTPIASLGGCLPTPLLAPFQSTLSQKAFDPIEALLAARGYNPRPNEDGNRRRGGSRFDAAEIARHGADAIVQTWTNYSSARKLPFVKRKGKANGGSQDSSNRIVKPYAIQSVARDPQTGARDVTEASMIEFLTGDGGGKLGMEEPWARGLFAPLAQPIPPSFPRMFKDLTADGRPRPRPGPSSDPVQSNNNNHHQQQQQQRPHSIPQFSTLCTTPTSTSHIRNAHRILLQAVRSHAPLSSYGLISPGSGVGSGQAASEDLEGRVGGRDGLKELLERVEELRGAYEVEDSIGVDEDEEGDGALQEDHGQGTDEDWQDTVGEIDDDDLDWN